MDADAATLATAAAAVVAGKDQSYLCSVAVATVVDAADGTVGENRLYFWNKRNAVTVVAATTAAVVAVAAAIVITVCKEQRPSCSVATVNRR